MAENKSKKVSDKQRLPQEVLDDIEEIKYAARVSREREPSYGELILKAWRVYKAHAGTGTSPGTDSSTQLSKSAFADKSLQGTLTQSEQDAVDLLLLIMRHGSETVKKAIGLNLEGFAEPIQSRGTSSGSVKHAASPSTDFSEAVGDLIHAFEAVGVDETSRRKWVEELKRLQTELGAVRGVAKKPRKAGGK